MNAKIQKLYTQVSNTNIVLYIFFSILVVIYNYCYLHQGFAAHLDEGYLISLGKRITDGQNPYTDFYFLRPPLSIYLQALYLKLFGDFHTIYLGRLLFIIQSIIIVILNTSIYQTLFKKSETFMILAVSYIITTLLLQFQWYSYDGLFFATLTLFFISRRKFILVGVSLLMAGMSKQNYFILLPFTIIVLFATQARLLSINKVLKEQLLKIAIGFCSASLIVGLFLLISGNFSQFITQVFLLPKEISNISTLYALFQNNPEAFVKSLLTIIAIVVCYNFKKNKFISVVLLSIISYSLYSDFVFNTKYFIFNIIYANYTIAILYYFNDKNYNKKTVHILHLFIPLTITIQYIAGFSYGGLQFAYMGAGLLVPVNYLILKKNLSFSFAAISIILLIGTIGYYHKTKYVYQDSLRPILSSTFNAPKLKYIYSSEKRTNHVNFITENVSIYSKIDDYIFFFPDYSSMYYITSRRNPTKIEWYYKLEYNYEMLKESIADLQKNKPKIIFLNSQYKPKILMNYISTHYTLVDSTFDIKMYLPKKEE